MIVDTKGEATFVVLEQDLGGDWAVRYGSGSKTSTPYFSKPIIIESDKSITCFGITLVS